MKSYIFAAATLLSAVASGSVLRREDDCATTSSDLPCGATTSYNYTVVSGDTLSKISSQSGAGICDIAKANKIANPDYITVGEVLIIPSDCTSIDNSTCLNTTPPATATCVNGVGSSYNVRSGDTLSAIASAFGITLDALEGANSQISNFDNIAVGQIINVPICAGSSCDSVGTYTVVSGDVFVDLASKYGVSVGQIESLNANVDPTKLAVGQTIILPQNCHA